MLGRRANGSFLCAFLLVIGLKMQAFIAVKEGQTTADQGRLHRKRNEVPCHATEFAEWRLRTLQIHGGECEQILTSEIKCSRNLCSTPRGDDAARSTAGGTIVCSIRRLAYGPPLLASGDVHGLPRLAPGW